MTFNINDIIRIDEPISFMPCYWNRSFKIVDMEYVGDNKEYPWWFIVEVIGEPIIIERGNIHIRNRYGDKIIRKFSITEEAQKDLILVKREGELIGKHIKKHKVI